MRVSFKVTQRDGRETYDAGDFPDEAAARERAHVLYGPNVGGCVEMFREQDPPDAVLYRLGTRPPKR